MVLSFRSINFASKREVNKKDPSDVITYELPIEMVGRWYFAESPNVAISETTRDWHRIPQSRHTSNGRPIDGNPLIGGPLEYWPKMTTRRNASGELIQVIIDKRTSGTHEIYRSIPLNPKMSTSDVATHAFQIFSLPVDRSTGIPTGEPETLSYEIYVSR